MNQPLHSARDTPAPKRHWTLDDIDWEQTRPDLVAGNADLFYMVAGASMIESMTDLYAHNLADHFAADPEIADWLNHHWQAEEMQHGRALRCYVEHAWPDFDWQAAFAGFMRDYATTCKPESLLRGAAWSASRCVVEMGTASYYTALSRASPDPVLTQVTRFIYEDEVSHYKHFYKYFLRENERERFSRREVLGALWFRLKMMQDEDSYIAIKHVRAQLHPGEAYDAHVYKRVIKGVRAQAAQQFPHAMAVKNAAPPLDLPPLAQRVTQMVVETMVRSAVV